MWWAGACWGAQAGRGSCEIPWPSAGGAQFPESPSRGAGGGWGKAAGVIGGSVPVRPAGLPLATDRPGQLAVPIPGLGSSDHSPDPSLDLCLALPQTCQWRGRAEEAGEPRVCAEPRVLGRSGREALHLLINLTCFQALTGAQFRLARPGDGDLGTRGDDCRRRGIERSCISDGRGTSLLLPPAAVSGPQWGLR